MQPHVHKHFTTALETVTAASQLGAAIQTMSLCVRPLMIAGLPVESGNGGAAARAAGAAAAASDALEAAAAAAAAGAAPASEEQRAAAAQAIASGGQLTRWPAWLASSASSLSNELPRTKCTLPGCRLARSCCHSLPWHAPFRASLPLRPSPANPLPPRLQP